MIADHESEPDSTASRTVIIEDNPDCNRTKLTDLSWFSKYLRNGTVRWGYVCAEGTWPNDR